MGVILTYYMILSSYVIYDSTQLRHCHYNIGYTRLEIHTETQTQTQTQINIFQNTHKTHAEQFPYRFLRGGQGEVVG